MFLGTLRQKHASTSRDFKSARGVLLGTDSSEKSQADPCAGQRPCILVAIDFLTLVYTSDQFIVLECKGRRPGNLMQDDVPAWGPLAVAQKFPMEAPDLSVDSGFRNGVQHPLTMGFPPAQRSDAAVPA